jgi:hypothetical protein
MTVDVKIWEISLFADQNTSPQNISYRRSVLSTLPNTYVFSSGGVFYPEDWGRTFLLNVGVLHQYSIILMERTRDWYCHLVKKELCAYWPPSPSK